MSERFHDCHWGQCLELLSHLCEYSESILLITGANGSGKTAMKEALIQQEGDQFIICDITATPMLTAEQLAGRIEEEFEDIYDRQWLLLIDDAQHLSLDVLAIILQLKQKTISADCLHIVLFATPDLEQKFARSVLKDDFAEQVHMIEIEPLTLDEVEAFLIQQWRFQKHTTDEMPLNRAKIKKIHALSRGLPGKVLEIATDMFEERAIKTEQQSLSPFAVGITVTFGIVFCILAILWPTADKDMLQKTESTVQPLQIAQDTNMDDGLIETAEFTTLAKIEPQPIVVEAENTKPAVDVISSAPVKIETDTIAVNVTPAVAEPEPVFPENVDQKIARLEQKIEDLQKQVQSDQKAMRATEQQLKQLLSNKSDRTAKPKVAKSAHIAKPIAKAANKTLKLSKHEKKILSLPGANYTLQLLCMNKEVQVQDFIKNNKLDAQAYYYKSHFKGKDWYIVVYGNYANKTEAQIALASLPSSLKKLHPWVREYVAVQQSISNR